MWIRWISLIALVLGLSLEVMAAQNNAKNNDEAMANRSRQRTYPGGKDEEDLVVQDKVSPPQRKLDKKAIESQLNKGFSKPSIEDEPAADFEAHD